MESANPFAYLALFSWPVIVIGVFAQRRRTHCVARTTAWLMLLSTMFLPSAIAYDPPLLPGLDKHRLTFLSIGISLYIFHRDSFLQWSPKHYFPTAVVAVGLVGVARTVSTNGDPLFFGQTVLPGLTHYDTLSVCVTLIMDWYLPFVIGQRVFRTKKDLRALFEVMSTCMLIYAPLMLFEVRMSPQLHNWFYGFYPSDFAQQMRYEGFRPVVFMNHGLSTAMWVVSCLCATLALQRMRVRTNPISTEQRLVIGSVLIFICKSLGPMLFAAFACLIVWFTSARTIARLSVVASLLVVTYPLSRAEQFLPAQEITGFFQGFAPERAESLRFRFDNEDRLLERAMLQPLNGWGTFGRSRIYSPEGADISVTDGYWIILLGNFGYVGFACFFALMIGPLLRFARNQKGMSGEAEAGAATLAVIVALFTLDLLPNSRSDFLSVVYAGILWTVSGSFAKMADGAVDLGINGQNAWKKDHRPSVKILHIIHSR